MFHTAALGTTPVDISTQATFAAGTAVRVHSVFVSFLNTVAVDAVVTLRSSDGGTVYSTITRSRSGAVTVTSNEVLSHFKFYASGGLEVVCSAAAEADVTVVFFDVGF